MLDQNYWKYSGMMIKFKSILILLQPPLIRMSKRLESYPWRILLILTIRDYIMLFSRKVMLLSMFSTNKMPRSSNISLNLSEKLCIRDPNLKELSVFHHC